MRILIVDDNVLSYRALRTSVERLGYATERAKNVDQALSTLHDTSYDLIILTVANLHSRPAESSSPLTKQLHFTRQSSTHTPILATSAIADPSLHHRCRQAGADGFLAKPFSLCSLSAAIDKIRLLIETPHS